MTVYGNFRDKPALVAAVFEHMRKTTHLPDLTVAGYRAYVPVDACGGLSSRTEDAAFREIEAAGGVTTSVIKLVTAPAPDFNADLGGKAFGILQSLRLASSRLGWSVSVA
jgi:hypothetical protein